MSPWEIKAEMFGVEYQPWTPPDYGNADRAHFDFQQFEQDQQALAEEVAALRTQLGTEPYTPQPRQAETAIDTGPTRQDKMERAADFLASIDTVMPPAA